MLQLESAGRILKVSEAKLEDSGKYSCLATNAAGEAQQQIRLSVHGNRAQSISSSSSSFVFPNLISVFFNSYSVFSGAQLQYRQPN